VMGWMGWPEPKTLPRQMSSAREPNRDDVAVAALKVSFSEVQQRRARIDCDGVIVLTVKRHDTHRVKSVWLSSCGGFEVLVEGLE
jgi:hypothetical protein